MFHIETNRYIKFKQQEQNTPAMKNIKNYYFLILSVLLFSAEAFGKPFLPATNLVHWLVPHSYSTVKKGSITRLYTLSPEITHIRIQAHYAHILLKQDKSKKKNQIKVQYNESLNIIEEESTLIVSEKDFPDEKAKWSYNRKRPILTLTAPSNLSLKIAVFAGKVEINKFWKTNLSVFMPGKGFINIKNTAGTLNISQGSGNIKITSHKGDITVQAENSRLHLQSCKGGKINLNSFKGRTEVNKSRGSLFTRSFRSPLILNRWTGKLDFQQEKGGVYLRHITGSISGYSKNGEVRGLIYPHEVNIKTGSGKIHLDMPYSKAWVTAETWEGRLFPPVYFNRIKTGGVDRAKGWLKGSKRKGNVSLKSRSGSIKVYQSVR